MRKNTASQVIGAQMVSATDGSAFTGAVTCYVTGDGGTQAAGSVGAGACTHEGNGYHTYAPAQAETNYDLIAFTFIGSGAVPATVQVFTGYPQTGDNYARLGAPAGASVSADVAAIKAETASILDDTDDIGAAGAGLTAVPWNAAWDAEVQSEVADALGVYDPPTKAELDTGLDALPTAAETASQVRIELATELAHLDEDVSAAGISAQGVADALKLAPSAGDPATGSVYDLIGDIQAGSGLTAQQTRDAMKLAPSAGAPAAGSVDDLLVDMPTTILATAIAAHDDTPGTVGYLLSLLAGLDFTAVNLVATSNAGEITIKRSVDLVAVVSGLTIPADWTECYWTVKRSTDDPDTDALVQLLVSNPGDAGDGVQVLAGEAVEDGSDGSLVVNQAGGTVTIALGNASTGLLDEAVDLVWDVKVHATSGKTQPGAGTATITTAVTRA